MVESDGCDCVSRMRNENEEELWFFFFFLVGHVVEKGATAFLGVGILEKRGAGMEAVGCEGFCFSRGIE